MAENNSLPPLMTDKELLMEGSAYSEIMAAAFEYADSYCSSGDEPRRYAVAIDHLRKTVRAEITKFSRANYKTNAATEFDAQAVAAQAPAAVADDAPLAVRTAPKKIWLDLGDDEAGDCDFSDLEEVTWSSNNASGCGIEYVRAALAATPALPATEDSSAGDLATESVLIEGVAYTIPEPVALELLRLNIELIQQAEALAESDPAGEYPALPDPDHALDCGMQPFYRPDQMRAFADATHAMRADIGIPTSKENQPVAESDAMREQEPKLPQAEGADYLLVLDPEDGTVEFAYTADLGRSFGHDHIKDAQEHNENANRWVVRPAYTSPVATQAEVQAEPVAYLHDDGYWTPAKTDQGRALNDRLLFAGSPKLGVFTTPQAPTTEGQQPMNEQLWTVARFPNGFWSTGGKPTDPDYAECEVFTILATSREQAKKKAQARRSTSMRKAAHAQPADALVAERIDDLYIALEVCAAELFAQCGDQGRAMKYVEQARKTLAAEQCIRAAMAATQEGGEELVSLEGPSQ